jgi:hypothetical protein
MPNVTIDADDLEALLFATGGIKDLETAIHTLQNTLAGRKQNPMVRAGMGKLEAAHERLSTAWRRAKREAEWPQRTVTEADLAELRAIFIDRYGRARDFVVLNSYPMRLAQELLLVESGPLWEGFKIEWPAPSDSEFRVTMSGKIRYGARLTHYGKQVLSVTDVIDERAAIGHQPKLNPPG